MAGVLGWKVPPAEKAFDGLVASCFGPRDTDNLTHTLTATFLVFLDQWQTVLSPFCLERISMSRTDYFTGKPLPSAEVLELARQISDDEISGDEQLVALLERYEVARTVLNDCRKRFNALEAPLKALEAEIEAGRAEIREIESKRPAVCGTALFGGQDEDWSADNALIERREAILLRRQRIVLGLPTGRELLRQADAEVDQATHAMNAINGDIARRRRELKLALAETRIR